MIIQKYPKLMRFMHWTMATIIIGLLVMGLLMNGWLSKASYVRDLYWWHKSFGVLVLMLIIARLTVRWHFRTRIPQLPLDMPVYERKGAHIGHTLLYLLMLLVPLSGYLMSSAYPKSSGISFFGIPLPDAIAKSEEHAQFFTGVHQIAAYAMGILIIGHILAVIKHRFFDKKEHDSLSKML